MAPLIQEAAAMGLRQIALDHEPIGRKARHPAHLLDSN
jgi:hypothetical protein